jgi:hypothetical protein
MPRLSAAPITLTTEENQDLRRLIRAHKTPRKLHLKAGPQGADRALHCLLQQDLRQAVPLDQDRQAPHKNGTHFRLCHARH